MTRYDSFVLRSGGGKKNSSGMTCMQGGGGFTTTASRKFSRNIFVSSLTHNHICSSQSMESTNNSTAVVVKVVQQFQSLCSGGNLQRQRALKVEEKQNSMWILSKIFQKQAMAKYLTEIFKNSSLGFTDDAKHLILIKP